MILMELPECWEGRSRDAPFVSLHQCWGGLHNHAKSMLLSITTIDRLICSPKKTWIEQFFALLSVPYLECSHLPNKGHTVNTHESDK